MKEKRLILHIGMHKTGSTSIQNSLELNREALADEGFFFPSVQPCNHSVSFYPLFMDDPNENFRMKGIYNITTEKMVSTKIAELTNAWKKALSRFAAGPFHSFIISAEDFDRLPFTGSIEKMKAFLSPYFDTILIFSYVREPKSYITSQTQQTLKSLYLSLEAAYEKTLQTGFRQGRVLTAYADIFGKSNMIVKPFIRSLLKNEDVVIDFLSEIEFTNISALKQAAAGGNESLGLYTTLLSSEYNKTAPALSDNRRITNQINRKLLGVLDSISQPRFSMKASFTEDDAKRINAEFKTVNTFLKSDYRFPSIEADDTTATFPSPDEVPKSFYFSAVKALEDALGAVLQTGNEAHRFDANFDMVTLFSLYQAKRLSPLVKIRNAIISLFVLKHHKFDSAYYEKAYPDVCKSGIAPLKHYICQGVYEGRLPYEGFDMMLFLKAHPETVLSGKNPLFTKYTDW